MRMAIYRRTGTGGHAAAFAGDRIPIPNDDGDLMRFGWKPGDLDAAHWLDQVKVGKTVGLAARGQTVVVVGADGGLSLRSLGDLAETGRFTVPGARAAAIGAQDTSLILAGARIVHRGRDGAELPGVIADAGMPVCMAIDHSRSAHPGRCAGSCTTTPSSTPIPSIPPSDGREIYGAGEIIAFDPAQPPGGPARCGHRRGGAREHVPGPAAARMAAGAIGTAAGAIFRGRVVVDSSVAGAPFRPTVLGHACASQPSRRTFRGVAIGAPERAVSYLLVLLGILLNVGAQVALKWAAQGLSPASPDGGAPAVPLSFATIAEDPLRVLLNPWFLLGLVLYAVSVVNWLVVLARMELSVAYPLMSAAYILTLLAGALLFKEPLSATRVVGTLVIIVGVILITRPVHLAHG